MAQTIGVVLAGGEGRRMGRPKGEIVLQSGNLAQRAAAALRPVCGSVIVSISRGSHNPAPSCSVVEDNRPVGQGPLAGIEAAFEATGRADLLVLACDYPGVGTALLKTILEHARDDDQLVMPVDPAGRDHPLVAVWRRSAEPHVRAALTSGRLRVSDLFPDLTVRRVPAGALAVPDAARALRNVNWPDDLAAFGG